MNVKEINLTEGSIFQKLIRFSLPMIAGNFLQQVYNLVDTLIVGKCIGADALASVGSAYTLMIFITSIIIGLCMGSGTFFSADYGAGDTPRLRGDIRLSFLFIAAVAAPILSEGDLLGAVLMIGQDPMPQTGETEYKLAQTIAAFLGRHMES